jgi:hypothetical protein
VNPARLPLRFEPREVLRLVQAVKKMFDHQFLILSVQQCTLQSYLALERRREGERKMFLPSEIATAQQSKTPQLLAGAFSSGVPQMSLCLSR